MQEFSGAWRLNAVALRLESFAFRIVKIFPHRTPESSVPHLRNIVGGILP
jgi:hypothetical protein